MPMEMNEMKLKTTRERMKTVSLAAGVFAAGIGSPVGKEIRIGWQACSAEADRVRNRSLNDSVLGLRCAWPAQLIIQP